MDLDHFKQLQHLAGQNKISIESFPNTSHNSRSTASQFPAILFRNRITLILQTNSIRIWKNVNGNTGPAVPGYNTFSWVLSTITRNTMEIISLTVVSENITFTRIIFQIINTAQHVASSFFCLPRIVPLPNHRLNLTLRKLSTDAFLFGCRNNSRPMVLYPNPMLQVSEIAAEMFTVLVIAALSNSHCRLFVQYEYSYIS